MTKKIIISKNVLEDLYINRKLSMNQIARQFSCDSGVIGRRLREYRLKLRQPKKKIIISKNKLFDLYINKKFSTQKVAKILGISSCTVYYKLKELGIETRHKKLVEISRKELKKLYTNNKLSCSEIANRFDCDKVTIFQKLRKFRIKTRNLSEACIIYPKKKFLGDNKLKAYMIGFRLGDLNVKTKTGETVLIKSNTTKKEQLDLIKKIYGEYGHFKVSHGKSDYCIWCNLDKSFSFLLPKEDKIEYWILNEDVYFLSFLAGYSDAEGNFGIYSKRARFRVGSYDKNILGQIANKLNLLGINAKFNLEGKAIIGKHNRDFYRVSINDKKSLLNFIDLMKSYIKHAKRYKDMILCEDNILKRNKKFEIKIKLMKAKYFQISTAIDYPSARFHLGHAYEKICADILARWKRLNGFDVHFSTGTDCHGLKIERKAEEADKTPEQFVNEISDGFRELCKVLNISYDDFIMTTEKRHENTVINILKELKNKGDIYKGEYEGLYCVDCETYYTEKDLENGKCPIHKKRCELIKESSYFFKLSKYQKKLIQAINEDNLLWPEKKKNEILARLEEPLKDLSISREKVIWGIPFPFEKGLTIFVWIDALINYLSTVNYPNKKFKDFWPAMHIIGPDIVWHHTVIWYSILLALGLELPKVVVHGFINLEGEKLSKARGITVDPIDLADKYSADSLRYFLARSIPFGEDGDFSEQALIDRHNNELANKLGNLVSRVSALIEKNGIEKCENKLLKKLNVKKIEKLFENFEFDKVLNEIFAFIDICNEYVQKKKPWETKDKKVLYELADSIKVIAILLSPFIPSTSEKIAGQFGFKIQLSEIKNPLNENAKIKKGEILFKKI
jgi:methionyl-tRNA synthetase